MANVDGIYECIEDSNYVISYLEVVEGHIFKPLRKWDFPENRELWDWERKGKKLWRESQNLDPESDDDERYLSDDEISDIRNDSIETVNDSSVNERQAVNCSGNKVSSVAAPKSIDPKLKLQDKKFKKTEKSVEQDIRPPPQPIKNGPYTLENTLSSILGAYIFTEYVEDVCCEFSTMAFVADVARYRLIHSFSNHHAMLKARDIIQFLLPKDTVLEDKIEVFAKQSASYRRSSLMHIEHGISEENKLSSEGMLQLHLTRKLGYSTEFKPPDPLYGKHIGRMTKNVTKYSLAALEKIIKQNTIVVDPVRGIFTDSDSKDDMGKEAKLVEKSVLTLTTPCVCQGLPFLSASCSTVQNVINIVNSWFPTPEAHAPVTSSMACTADLFDEIDAIVMEIIRKKHWKQFKKHQLYRKLCRFLWLQERGVNENDFAKVRVLGRGGFGLVHAVKKVDSGMLYALKTQDKCRLASKNAEKIVVNEREALAEVNSPFVTSLKYAFETSSQLFFVLELLSGGNLAFHLHHMGKFSKKTGQYFASCISLGLQALHTCGYVYRDLKPENILMDVHGHIKLSDLGLACKVTPDLSGAAGTCGYWAPEVLQKYDDDNNRVCYDQSADWFSFGVIIYEFVCGIGPFYTDEAISFGLNRLSPLKSKKPTKSDKKQAMNHAVLLWEPTFESHNFDEETIDLCSKLLDKNRKTRLGAQGWHEVMAHPWFEGINWPLLMVNMVKPPYKPPPGVNAQSQHVIGTFDKCENKKLENTSTDAYNFKWAWTNPESFQTEVVQFLQYENKVGNVLLPEKPSCCCSVS